MANYQIQAGDTLGALAQANNTTVANLQALNPNITDPNKIYAGQNLVISAEGLNSGETPVNIPTPNVPPPPQIIPPATDTTIDPALQKILDSYQEPTNPADQYTAMEDKAGIAQKTQDVANLTGQINSLLAQQRVQEAQIGKEAISAGAIKGRNLDLERQNYMTLQPLQVQLAIKQGDLTTAQNHLDKMFGYQQDYEKAKMDFENKKIDAVYAYATKAQQDALDAKKAQLLQDNNDRVNNLNQAQTWATTAISQGQGELASQIMALDPKDPNYQTKLGVLAGQIKQPVDELKQLQIAKLRKELGATTFDGYLDETDVKKIDASPQGKAVKALGTLKQKVEGYKELVDKYGTSSFGKQKAQLEAAFADLKIAYKEAANLGALTGPDVALLEEAVKPATSGWFGGQWYKVLSGQGKGTILSGLDQTLGIINKSATSNIQQLYARDPRYPSSYYVQEITNPFKDQITLSDTQIEELTKGLSPEQIQQLKDEGLLPQ
jgi:LysM repeat protein